MPILYCKPHADIIFKVNALQWFCRAWLTRHSGFLCLATIWLDWPPDNQTGRGLCKTPFPSLLRRQEPSLKRSFSCRAGSRHQNMRNQIFDFIGILLFSEKCETSKALLCAGHPPTRVRQISGFAKISGRLKAFRRPVGGFG